MKKALIATVLICSYVFFAEKDFEYFAFNKKELYLCTRYRGVEQLVARQAHNLEVIGSSPVSATKKRVAEMWLFFLYH